MKEILYVFALCTFCSSYGMSQHSVSYHSIVENNKQQEVLSPPYCKNAEELQGKITDNTIRFISATPLEKKDIAEKLVIEYESIFCTNEDSLSILRELENDVDQQSRDKLSNEFLTETADGIAYLCDGLPSAAVDIQNMYEVSGKYSLSLLWAVVAYRFGLLRAEDAIGRSIIAMKY